MKVHEIASAVITFGLDTMGPQEPLFVRVLKARDNPMRVVLWFT